MLISFSIVQHKINYYLIFFTIKHDTGGELKNKICLIKDTYLLDCFTFICIN